MNNLTKQKTILIADDVEFNRELLKNVFDSSYHIVTAANGQDVIEILQNPDNEVHLLLLDLAMPVCDGFQVLEYMKQHNLMHQIPVIVITGTDEFSDEIRAYHTGATDVIHKPFVPQIVMRRADNIIELFESRRQIEKQLEAQSRKLMEQTIVLEDTKTHDALTGLLNMKQFLVQANTCLKEADLNGTYKDYAFVYGNIRNFKYYNVRYGVESGNHVLLNLSELVQEIGQDGIVSRFGNDHFVVLVKKKQEELVHAIEEMTERFNTMFQHKGMKLKTGIYYVKKQNELAATAADLAKMACDSIRKSKDNYAIYDNQLDHAIEVESYVLQNIDKAIEQGYIQVYFQPVVRTINGTLCGMEALARWIDPELGFLSPADFIPTLEENRMITKLDLHVLRIVCKQIRDCLDQGEPISPVSFNLSRYDFIECDIFQEVETIVLGAGIPRDMINIEITESTIMENSEILKREIERFRKGGYQVWMDDFGSGYSSLNVLKEFHFDEIKLDMAFLRSFNENSKTIVKSIIQMAKELGIQTLAEGVETAEQLQFLREIGCEKAQGYFYSKPMSFSDIQDILSIKHIAIEQRSWRNYFESLSKTNLLTDRSLALMEYDGTAFQPYYYNEEFINVLHTLGIDDLQTVQDDINSSFSPISQQLHEMQFTLQVGDEPQQIVFSLHGDYLRLLAKCIAQHDNRRIYEIEITNLSNHEQSKKREQLDTVFRMMYAMYDSIYLLDFTQQRFEVLLSSVGDEIPEAKGIQQARKINDALFSKMYIHPQDQKKYADFIDQTTLIDRLKHAERCYLTEYFRTRISNGSFVWKAHTMLYVPSTKMVIYAERYVPFDQTELIQRIAPKYLLESIKAGDALQHVLHKTLMDSRTIHLFWKDKQRRFLGANQKFLSTYGIKDVNEIIGKTDEEMGWHLDNAPFRDDEWDVLEKGKVIRNHVGKCIIKGVVHSILVNKEPLYEDGKIVGLVGTFLSLDEMEQTTHPNTMHGSDPLTGMMSAQGVTNAIADFADGWLTRKENFATIRINIREYHRAAQTYGETIAKRMLKEVALKIQNIVGNHGSCARLYAGNFVLLIKCSDKHMIETITSTIQNTLTNIHVLAGYPATINPGIEVYYANESRDLHGLIGLATGGTVLDIAERKILENKLSRYNIPFETILNSLPGGIVIQKIQDDGKLEVVYVSDGMTTLCGYGNDEFLITVDGETSFNIHDEDRQIVKKAIRDAVQTGRNMQVNFRVPQSEGKDIWIDLNGRIIGEEDGSPLLLATFQNVTASGEVYEDILNQAIVSIFVFAQNTNTVLYENATAKQLINQAFNGDINHFMHTMMVNQADYYEMEYDNHHYHIQQEDCTWYKHPAKLCYVMDNTSHWQELEQSKELVSNVPAVICQFRITKAHEIQLLYLSEQASQYLGELPTGKPKIDTLLRRVDPDDQVMLKNQILDACSQAIPFQVPFRVMKDGKTIWIRMRAKPIPQADGSILYDAIANDITIQMHANQALATKNADKLEHYHNLLTGLNSISQKKIVAHYVLNLKKDKMVQSWIYDKKARSYMHNMEQLHQYLSKHAFSKKDSDSITIFLDREQILQKVRKYGYFYDLMTYLTRGEQGRVQTTYLEYRAIEEKDTNQVVMYLSAYHDTEETVPSVFLEHMMALNLDKLCVYNQQMNVYQEYQLTGEKEIRVGSLRDYQSVCQMYAKKNIDAFHQAEFLRVMDIDYIRQRLAKTPMYQSSFITFEENQRKRKNWTFCYADEECQNILMARSDASNAQVQYESENYLARQNDILMSNIPGGVFQSVFLDYPKIILINKGFTEITGYTLEEMEQQFNGDYLAICFEDDMERVRDTVRRLRLGQTDDSLIYRIRHKNGKLVWISQRITALQNDHGQIETNAVILDITTEMEEQEKLQTLVDTDPLSGLLNTSSFKRETEKYLSIYPDSKVAMVMIDIDNFKHINDTYGHQTGDSAIQSVADFLKHYDFEYPVLTARLGGDEFGIFIMHIDDWQNFDSCKQRFVDAFHIELITLEDTAPYTFTGSIGIAKSSQNNHTYDALLKDADKAMYEEKKFHHKRQRQ